MALLRCIVLCLAPLVLIPSEANRILFMKKILFIALVISSISTFAAGKGGAFLDPKEAGLDFAIQGEYTGESAEGGKVGLNIIALGWYFKK